MVLNIIALVAQFRSLTLGQTKFTRNDSNSTDGDTENACP
jgi:hypothetical protein